MSSAATSEPVRSGRERRTAVLAADKLPAGRHGLPREQVVENQRDRITCALVEVVTSHGFAAAAVERIASRAGVSRRTFYEQFSGKEDAFVAAYAAEAGRLRAAVVGAIAGTDDLAAAVRTGLERVLDWFADDPDVAGLLVVEPLVAGVEAIRCRDEHTHRWAEELDRLALRHAGRPLPPLTAEGLVGAVYDVIYKRLVSGAAAELPGLRDDLHRFCLQQLRPYESVGVV